MPKITELFAYVSTDADGEEAIPAVSVSTADGTLMIPLVGADAARMDALRGHAALVVATTGEPLRLCRFVLSDSAPTQH